ncbi:DNA-3-methyladenine glycosylase 2 [Massilia sp. S19_KUP03_FR1]|uniref:DNA-3-methyladenine glycosylase 2 n=1 Tax=Massilia sp. S19_KUP03_FR1 TaxID=3025503 RepID=UPI002FCD76AF
MTHHAVPLPPGYRVADVLAFHARDAEGVAEQVTPAGFRKGVLVDGVPVLFEVAFSADAAHCTLAADGALPAAAAAALPGMLALHIDPAPFAAAVRADPWFGPLVARTPGLRIVQSASVFEALTWAIIGQQINVAFAIALRRTLILQAGRQHSSGIWCYPEAADVAALAIDALTARKFSRAKAETILRLARLVATGELSLEDDAPVADIATRLLAVKGIGPWTVNYALLRGYGYADCSLHGDVAVRSALQRLLDEDVKPDIARTELLLARYAPYRTMAAAYLWRSLGPY